MNTNEFFKNYKILNIINTNNNIKRYNIKLLNSFKNLYSIINSYEKQDKSYESIMSDYDSRIEFLIKSVAIALSNKTMDEKTKDIVIQTYLSLYNYLINGSNLREITIPDEIKSKIHSRNFLPSNEQLEYLMTLIYSNKKIYDEEFEGIDFSQTINNGLHKNITEVLSINKSNLSHLLGLTSEKGSLYAFYKKTIIDQKINDILKEINWDNTNNPKQINEFCRIFKTVFKLDYSKENYIKLITWRYKTEQDLKRKLTEEEKILNEISNMAPKSQTIEFYSNTNNISKLIKENEKVNDFIYEYIRNEILLKKLNSKNTRKSVINQIKQEDRIAIIEDQNISTKDKTLRHILDEYVENSKIKLDEDNNLKEKFKNNFGYSYPLIEFDKLLTKNISFYNFSLFENLNSIIVDYQPKPEFKNPQKETEELRTKKKSDLFLVSYSKKEREKLDKQSDKILNEDNVKESNNNITNDYISLIKSLINFPPEDRYYFRQMDNKEENYKNMILKEKINTPENISLIGFASSKEEKERISKYENNSLIPFEHYHYCETICSTNYYEYITSWTKEGIEYPISMITEKTTGRILKLERYSDNIKYNIKIFNEYRYNKQNSIDYSINYEKKLIKEISKQLDNYIHLQEINIKLYEEPELNKNLIQNDKENNTLFDSKKEKILELYKYNIKLKDYFKEYINLLDNKEEKKENNSNNKTR